MNTITEKSRINFKLDQPQTENLQERNAIYAARTFFCHILGDVLSSARATVKRGSHWFANKEESGKVSQE